MNLAVGAWQCYFAVIGETVPREIPKQTSPKIIPSVVGNDPWKEERHKNGEWQVESVLKLH